MSDSAQIVKNAVAAGVAIPSLNVPYLPMLKPLVQAVTDLDSFAFIAVARLEWIKFESGSLQAVREGYLKWHNPRHIRLHLDHVPVIDEDELLVDFLPIIAESIDLGYDSVMVDGSRLDLDENIRTSRQVADVAHAAGIPCEAELGAVLGHGSEEMPPYEELFASGKGFTDVDEARRFASESGCDWISVAIGNIHGAIAAGIKDQKKPAAKLNLEHIDKLREATGLPMVIHGGSGIERDYVLEGFKRGVAKINICLENRQTYEKALLESGDVAKAQQAVYDRACPLLGDYYQFGGIRGLVTGEQ